MLRIMCIVALALVVQMTLGQTQSHRRSMTPPGAYEGSEVPLFINPSQQQIDSAPRHNDSPNATFTVSTINDTGAGSLRKAISDANANPGLDYITFSIGPPGNLASILPKTPLPVIISPVVIDGTTQPGYSGQPHVEIRGDDIFTASSGLVVESSAAGSIIRGIGVSFFPGDGIEIYANNTVVDGCRIGYSIFNVGMGNSYSGIFVNASNSRIGGTADTARNIIASNGTYGILVWGLANNNIIQGNYIGLDASGTFALGNKFDGIRLNWSSSQAAGASNTLIGGTTPGARNIISGNDSAGIGLYGQTVANNRILGNYIGTNPAGTQAIPNGREGIRFWNFSSQLTGTAVRNIIGGATPGERNVISGNGRGGISFVGGPSGGNDNLIIGNVIGLNASASSPLANGADGISLRLPYGGVLTRTQIGGSTADSGNFICNNRGAGVSLSGAGVSQTRIRRNSISGNDSLGIDLGANRVTPNDSLDGDTGPNGLQNFPIIDSVIVTSSSTKIFGRLDAKPNQRYTLDFYTNNTADAWHFGEGKTFFTQDMNVVCDITGRAQFQAIVSSTIPLTQFITATATDDLGNTSEFSQAFSPADQDGDGIYDIWETQGWGIDVNSDAVIDLDLYTLGAKPDHKDIFVEVDAMAQYGPPDGALDSVRNAFARVNKDTVRNPDGQPGIALHVEPDNYNMSVWDFPLGFTNFKTVKDTAFGTAAQRSSPNARHILAAKQLVYRYCIFAKTYGVVSDDINSSGLAEDLLCNDFMVTFGSTGASGWNNTRRWQDHAGTFMHELGHTLGLDHGGNDDMKYKINYISVMNYLWQKDYKWIKKGSWNLDYSLVPLPMLDELNLDETRGLNPPAGAYGRIMSFPFIDGIDSLHWGRLAPGVAVDWNGDGDSTDVGVNVDLNSRFPPPAASPGEMMTGFADWSALRYNFRNTASFGTVLTRPNVVFRELTFEMADSLDNLPPPVPGGMFQMDGQLDATATLVSSNGGVNLYATRRGPQLYVATTSAQAQGGDVMIFLTKDRGALKPAPWQKSGQVASWDAVLVNESTTNVPIWLDADAVSISGLVVNSASGFLEGVMDMDLFFGEHVNSVYVALGRYSTENGGGLLVQVPTGNGDGNIDSTEFLVLTETPLPIQLASFTATPLPNARVRLDWVTLSEVNNYGFEIQRKRTGDPEFQTLSNSFVPGHGTTNEPHSYSFIDTTASSGQWSYRLKQIDLDGTVHYGPEVVVDLLTGVEEGTVPAAFALYQNFPNPFNPTTSIRFDVPRLSHVNLIVYNALGQDVMTLVNEVRRPGKYQALFNADRLSSGVYFYKLTIGGDVSTKKMILTK